MAYNDSAHIPNHFWEQFLIASGASVCSDGDRKTLEVAANQYFETPNERTFAILCNTFSGIESRNAEKFEHNINAKKYAKGSYLASYFFIKVYQQADAAKRAKMLTWPAFKKLAYTSETYESRWEWLFNLNNHSIYAPQNRQIVYAINDINQQAVNAERPVNSLKQASALVNESTGPVVDSPRLAAKDLIEQLKEGVSDDIRHLVRLRQLLDYDKFLEILSNLQNEENIKKSELYNLIYQYHVRSLDTLVQLNAFKDKYSDLVNSVNQVHPAYRKANKTSTLLANGMFVGGCAFGLEAASLILELIMFGADMPIKYMLAMSGFSMLFMGCFIAFFFKWAHYSPLQKHLIMDNIRTNLGLESDHPEEGGKTGKAVAVFGVSTEATLSGCSFFLSIMFLSDMICAQITGKAIHQIPAELFFNTAPDVAIATMVTIGLLAIAVGFSMFWGTYTLDGHEAKEHREAMLNSQAMSRSIKPSVVSSPVIFSRKDAKVYQNESFSALGQAPVQERVVKSLSLTAPA